MELFNSIGLDGSYFIMGLLISQLLIFILVIVLMVKHRKLKRKYLAFMKGADASSLESAILTRFNEIDTLKNDNSLLNSKLTRLKDNMLLAYQKVGIVKYDAFKEMGGKLSFSICLLDDNNDGFVLTSMHSSREGCYTYVKEIIKGESFVLLSEEEKQSLKDAINKKNFMG